MQLFCGPDGCPLSHPTNSVKQGGHKPGKPGILREFSEPGKLQEFSGNSVQPWKKYNISNNFSTIEYLHTTTVDWVNRIIMISE